MSEQVDEVEIAPQTPKENKLTDYLSTAARIAIVLFLIFGSVWGVIQMLKYIVEQADASGTSLTVAIIVSIVISILILTVVSIAFWVIKSSNAEFALGLPQGSVRALIALTLITSFAIISVFLFENLANEKQVMDRYDEQEYQKLTSDDFQNMTRVSIITDSTVNPPKKYYEVTKSIGLNKDAADFAKQILTTLSTLVIAISSFYFGAKATQ